MIPSNGALHNASAVEIRDMLRARKISCSELVEDFRRRHEAVDPLLNAMPTTCFDEAMERARAIDILRNKGSYTETVLGGVPVGIKDLAAVAGIRSTWGTRALSEFVPALNDPIVDRLIDSGAIVVGKTNTPEMGAGNVTFNDVFGATRNPWNITRNPGGSSGGSCAAVSACMLPLAHGTDLAGSLRNPASYCGVTTLRPTPGRAGGPPQSVLFNTETVHGPIARSVADVALMLDAMVGFDPRIPISIEAPDFSFLERVFAGPERTYRVGLSLDLDGFAKAESGIADLIDKAVTSLSSRFLDVRSASPKIPHLYDTYSVLRSMLWASGPGSQPPNVQQHYKSTLQRNISKAHALQADDIYRALTNRTKLYNSMLEFFRTYDCLLCPVIGKQPGPIEEEYPREIAGETIDDYVDWLRFSFLAPAASLPAAVIPIGLDQEGMPVGIQLIGKPRGEAELLVIASVFEREFCFDHKPQLPI